MKSGHGRWDGDRPRSRLSPSVPLLFCFTCGTGNGMRQLGFARGAVGTGPRKGNSRAPLHSPTGPSRGLSHVDDHDGETIEAAPLATERSRSRRRTAAHASAAKSGRRNPQWTFLARTRSPDASATAPGNLASGTLCSTRQFDSCSGRFCLDRGSPRCHTVMSRLLGQL
jgi:hypothetical protein